MPIIFDEPKSKIVFDEDTPTGLPRINEPTTAEKPDGIQIPPSIQKAAQVSYTPVRGTRAIGVGFEKLLEGINPMALTGAVGLTAEDLAKVVQNASGALQSASNATQPGYVSQPGEKIGSFLGETAGLAGLTAPLAGAAPAIEAAIEPSIAGVAAGDASPMAASLVKAGINAAVDAPAAAALTATQQASEQGKLDPWTIAGNTALAAGLPFVVPAAQAFKGAVKQLLPETLAKTANIPQKATKALMEDPNIMVEHAGLEESVKQRVGEVQQRLVDIRKAASDSYGKELERLGLAEPFDQQVSNLADKEIPNMTPSDIAQAFQVREQIPKEQRLKYLYQLRKQIDDKVDFRPGVVREINSAEEGLLKRIRMDLNKDLHGDSLPGAKALKKADAAFSEAAGLYDQLQRKLETPGQAEDALMKVFRGDLNILTKGRSQDIVEALDHLDKMAGEPVTKKLWKELTALYFNQYLGKGLGSYMVGGAGVNLGGTAAMTGHPAIAAVSALASVPLVSPKVASWGIRGAAKVSPYVEQFINSIHNPKLQSAIISSIVAANSKKEKK